MTVEIGQIYIQAPSVSPEITREKPPLLQKPSTKTDIAHQEAINPMLLNVDLFKALDGHMQELSLISLLKNNDLAKIAELRPDFNIYTPLGKDEIAISFLIEEIIKREKPITVPPSFAPDRLFAQIYALGYPIEKDALASKLETERRRTKFEFPGNLFAPIDSIGTITPARRYLANLSMAIEEERVQEKGKSGKVYTRNSFKPVEPPDVDQSKLSEEDKEKRSRMRDAVDAYNFEMSLAGVPFS